MIRTTSITNASAPVVAHGASTPAPAVQAGAPAAPASEAYVAGDASGQASLETMPRSARLFRGGLATARDIPTPAVRTADATTGSATGALLGPAGGAIVETLSSVAPALARTFEGLELENREVGLDQRIAELEASLAALAADQDAADAHAFDAVEQERESAEQGLAERQAVVDQRRGSMALTALWRQARLNGEETALAESHRNPEVAVRTLAEQRRADAEAALEVELQQRRSALEARERGLDERQAELDRKGRDMEAIVADESERRFDRKSTELQASLVERTTRLDTREAALKTGTADFEARQGAFQEVVSSEVALLRNMREAEMERDLHAVDDVLRESFDARREELLEAHSTRASVLDEAYAQREAELKAPVDTDAARLVELTQRLQDLRKSASEWEAAISRSKANAAELAARATKVLSPVDEERTRLEKATATALSEARALETQVNHERIDIQTLERTVNDVRADCERVQRDIGYQQSAIASLQNEAASLQARL